MSTERSWLAFVGATLRPEPATVARLAEAGLHSTWLADADAALAASRAARFDAVLIAAAAAPPAALLSLRAGFGCPLLVLGQHDEEVEAVLALECGADAYLHPPLAPRRLLATVLALLRLQRRGAGPPQPAACFAGWVLCRASGRLAGHGHALELTPTQARLLARLMDAAGRAVARTELRAELPHGARIDSRAVDVYLSRLRLRLAQEGVARLRIQPVRGCGYALVEAQAEAEGPARAGHEALAGAAPSRLPPMPVAGLAA